jgi:hypothetical protein
VCLVRGSKGYFKYLDRLRLQRVTMSVIVKSVTFSALSAVRPR